MNSAEPYNEPVQAETPDYGKLPTPTIQKPAAEHSSRETNSGHRAEKVKPRENPLNEGDHMDIKQTLTDLATDLISLKHADSVQGADVTVRSQRIDRMIGKIEAAISALDAEALAEAEKA